LSDNEIQQTQAILRNFGLGVEVLKYYQKRSGSSYRAIGIMEKRSIEFPSINPNLIYMGAPEKK
jgi:hypothetical protein